MARIVALYSLGKFLVFMLLRLAFFALVYFRYAPLLFFLGFFRCLSINWGDKIVLIGLDFDDQCPFKLIIFSLAFLIVS